MSVTFDPQQYKITTRAQWEGAADAWHRWGPVIEDWLGAATERMLDATKITTASRVLDVAAGAGIPFDLQRVARQYLTQANRTVVITAPKTAAAAASPGGAR